MIDFPYSETAGWFGVQFALIGTALAIVFLFVARIFGFRIMFRRLEPRWYPGFLLIIPLAMFIGSAFALPAFWTVNKFRSLDFASLGSLRIRQTNESNGRFVSYTNLPEIRNMLQLMRHCRGVYHRHDELYDGYVLEVLMNDEKSANFFLKVYRQSSVLGSRKTVIAQYAGSDAGEYDCPEIQDWVVRVVDPLFGRSTARIEPLDSPHTVPSPRPFR